MKLSEIKEILGCQEVLGTGNLDAEVSICLGSDMMSDVLAFAKPGALLLTGLTNTQSVRTAEIADAGGVVYVRGKKPDEDTIRLARELSIPILATRLSMFEACGILFANGLRGIG